MEVAPINLAPIVQSTANSLDMIGQTVLGAAAIISLVIAGIACYILIRQAKLCFEGTKKSLDENTSMIREFKDSNKESMHGIQMILAKIETRLER